MRGLGTIVNVLAVVAGSVIGMTIKNGLKQRFQDILMQACGVSTIFIGAAGALTGLLKVTESGSLETQNTLLLIFSLVIGGLIGEALNIELFMEHMGERLKARVNRKNDSRFVDGFMTASLVICVGAMAIVGSIQDGLTGDASMLFTKAILDFVIVMVFASTLGMGVLFSALPLGIYQGGITLLSVVVAPFFTDAMISNLSFVGSALIFCVGINIAFGNRIKVANLLPAVVVTAVLSVVSGGVL